MAPDTRRHDLNVGGDLHIPPGELDFRATRASGPGGQHVNTSSTRVEVIWRVATSAAVTDAQRTRIARKLASRLDAAGNLRVVASDTRSQRQNRILAEQRLVAMVARALVVPRPRRKTAPSRGAIERRLSEKHRRAERKAGRQRPDTA